MRQEERGIGNEEQLGKSWQVGIMLFAITQLLDVHEWHQGVLPLKQSKPVTVNSLQRLVWISCGLW